jgi:hypothetical protein
MGRACPIDSALARLTVASMRALDQLLASLVDYAGLFPPAKLPMADAVRNHADYLLGPDRAALGRFIVPLARLQEFEEAWSRIAPVPATGCELSVIAGAQPAEDWARIRDFNDRHDRARIVSVETKAATPAGVTAAVAGIPSGLEAWIEISPTAPDLADQLAQVKATGHGAKLRMGGVTPEAFPAAADVLRFLVLCRDLNLVFKATAGLHHPLRGDYRLTYEPGSPQGRMFGFLNLFLAATLLHQGGSETDALLLLEDANAAHFHCDPDALKWRHCEFTLAVVASARQRFCRSYGSCSFTEPIEGLRELSWI